MKRLFLLLCLIPALLLCSCGQTAEAPKDESQQLTDMAKDVALAYCHGKFKDVESYLLFNHKEQLEMLFPGQETPYTFENYQFASDAAVLDGVRSHLISAENPEFTVTVIDAVLEMHTDATGIAAFGYLKENDLKPLREIPQDAPAATVTVTLSLDNGEEKEGQLQVCFLQIDGQWKVYSPSPAGYFLSLYQTNNFTHGGGGSN
jgi:hypothetical protein